MNRVIPFITIAFVAVSCTKEIPTATFGCIDTDAVNHSSDVSHHDSTCTYIYVVEYEVLNYKAGNWDPSFADDFLIKTEADIKIEVASNSDFLNVEFGSFDIESADPDSSHKWTAATQFILNNSTWYWRLMDDDDNPIGDGDDFIAEGSFNAIQDGNGAFLESISADNTTKIRIHYDVR